MVDSEPKPEFPYSPYPTGWYAVGFSTDLTPGDVQRHTLFGKNWVLWRTESGVAHLSDAYCPHLGAHLGYGGQVCGETLRCPFHHFTFDGTGTCTSTPYGGKVPPKARLGRAALEEKHGLLLAWFDTLGRPPLWQIPTLDMTGWTDFSRGRWTLRTHPQETTENSVDIGHFAVVHHYTNVAELSPVQTDGHYLTARYAMSRRALPIVAPEVRTAFTVHVYGLGYSLVEVEVEKLGIRSRHFVLPTPVDGSSIVLRGAVSVPIDTDVSRVNPALGLLPKSAAVMAIREVVFRGFANDIAQDFEIWQNKRYVEPPALAATEGPVGVYRRWCRQFYPEVGGAGAA